MILYLTNPRCLDFTYMFSKVAGYKKCTKASRTSVYWQWTTKKEIRKTIPLMIAWKVKYLAVNLMKEEKYTHNKTINPWGTNWRNTRRLKDLSRSWIHRINNVKMVILQKSIYIFSVISIKIPFWHSLETQKNQT
jgi:hypothetical protein